MQQREGTAESEAPVVHAAPQDKQHSVPPIHAHAKRKKKKSQKLKKIRKRCKKSCVKTRVKDTRRHSLDLSVKSYDCKKQYRQQQ